MRQTTIVALFAAGLLAVVALLVGHAAFADPGAPTMTWNAADEIAAPTGGAPIDGASGDLDAAATREALAAVDGDVPAERTEVTLRGRVVDRYRRPVPQARVWLDFARGGPFDRSGAQRRVPEPVETDAEGRFAFRGMTFRNLRVALLVAHRSHAPTQFERNLGEVQSEMDLGELVVVDGGEFLGRVTDLDGNGIPAATVQLQPDNGNQLRFSRERDAVLPPAATDNNGYYRVEHVAAGDWRVSATAAHHQNGSSDVVTARVDQRTEVEDIQLGPGYQLAGLVSDSAGKPVADAEVSLRARWNPGAGQRGPGSGLTGDQGGGRGGRGGRGGGPGQGPFGGGDHRTRTDAQGRFFVEHLPASLDLSVQKPGYLHFQQTGLDATSGQQLFVTLQDGLRISGNVVDGDSGKPVTRFWVAAERLHGLPTNNGNQQADWQAALQRLGADNLDEGARAQLRARFEQMRRGGDGGGPMGPMGPLPRGSERGDHKPADHPGGRFAETGLQEGVYVVLVESEDHAPARSAEVELRLGTPAPDLTVALARGFSVSGVVHDAEGQPIAAAEVELRIAEPAGTGAEDNVAGGRRGDRRGPQIRQLLNGLGGAVASATTGRDGRFSISHVAAGRYRVSATAKGRSEARSEPFALAADVNGVDLVMDPLGRLTGSVRGASAAQLAEVRVIAVPTASGLDFQAMFRGNGRPFASVEPDGTYMFDGLAPGTYAVRAFAGNGMRELFAQVAGGGELPADVTVHANETAHLDVALTLSQSGSVRGSVLHNGAPAAGFQVSLQRDTDGSGADQQGPGPGGRRGFGPGRDFNASVDDQGRFQIDDVPAGTYRLALSGERRSGTLHAETVVVTAQSATEVTISVATGAIDGEITATDGTPLAELDGNIALFFGVTDPNANLGELRRSGQVFRARVQNGRFAAESLPGGSYLAVLNLTGRAQATAAVVAAVGQRTSVSIAAGARAAADAQNGSQNAPGNQPVGPGPGGGNRRNGGGGGNGRRNGAPGGGNGDSATPTPRRGRRGG